MTIREYLQARSRLGKGAFACHRTVIVLRRPAFQRSEAREQMSLLANVLDHLQKMAELLLVRYIRLLCFLQFVQLLFRVPLDPNALPGQSVFAV